MPGTAGDETHRMTGRKDTMTTNTATARRYSVLCNLSPQEYEEQRALAGNDPGRRPPRLEMLSHHHLHPFNDGHISRIAADAYAYATGEEPSDIAQERLETAATAWTIEKRIGFMNDATPHWLPPVGGEMSHWYTTTAEAKTFLNKHPEIQENLHVNDVDEA